MNLIFMIEEISKNKVLIPDFQRGFVWKDLEMQRRLIASVFAKLPIGSILLLEGNPNEFQAKQIGRYEKIDVTDDGQKRYLLDGQQRMTVLTNVFSNAILEKGNVSKLVSPSLKSRFFLEIRPSENFDDVDMFGLSNLCFPFLPNGDPSFLADQVFESISVESSSKHEVLPFDVNYSTHVIQTLIVAYCLRDLSAPKIPLMLFSTQNGLNLVTKILKSMAVTREEVIAQIIEDYFNGKDLVKFVSFIDSIKDFINEAQVNEFYRGEEPALNELAILRDNWVNSMREYISRLVQDLNLNEIVVPNTQRARAIDIYENLNKGGVVLSTFDLVVAKVAQIDSTNFLEMMLEELKKPIGSNQNYPSDFVFEEWSAIESMEVFQEKKLEFSSIFINVFLNLLAVTSRTSSLDFDVKPIDFKRDAILNLTPYQIINNYRSVIVGIKRALCFMNIKLGIRRISDIKYEHVLLNLARVFTDNDWWQSSLSFRKLQYWYWIVMFSGSYDKDQTTQMIKDMKFLNKFLNNETTFEDQYLSSLKDRIFSIHYFTNKDILLLKQVEFNNIPKKIIRELIVQFILSRVPADFINDVNGNVKYLKAYSNQDYEVHHIIPLNTCKTVGQSTKDLRNNDEHYLNSPINFTIISSEANKSISSESLDSYSTRLPSLSNLNHFLPPLNFLASDNSEQKQKEWLSLRYDTIKASLATMLNDLSNNI